MGIRLEDRRQATGDLDALGRERAGFQPELQDVKQAPGRERESADLAHHGVRELVEVVGPEQRDASRAPGEDVADQDAARRHQ